MITNDIFETLLGKMSHFSSLIRKEVYIVISHILCTMPKKFVKELIEKYDTLLKDFLEGLKEVTQPHLLLEILDTVDHFGKIDHELGYQKDQSLIYLIEVSGGLELMEQLQMCNNETVYNRIIDIFNRYTGVEEELEIHEASNTLPPFNN